MMEHILVDIGAGFLWAAALLVVLAARRPRRRTPEAIAARRAEIESSYPAAFIGQMKSAEFQELVDRQLRLELEFGR